MVMEADNADAKKPRGKNIVIFSDGTGQRGGDFPLLLADLADPQSAPWIAPQNLADDTR